MKLLDTNIIVYAGKSEYAYLRSLITDTESVTSVITKIESLGFHRIKPDEKRFLEGIFALLPTLPISNSVVDKAIKCVARRI